MPRQSLRSVLTGCMLTVLVVGCGSPGTAESVPPNATASTGPPASATASLTPSPSVATSPSATTQPGEGAALTIEWTEQTVDGWVNGIAIDGDRIVAVGRTGDEFAAWTSTDGMAWDMAAVPPPANFLEDSEGLPADLEARGSQMGMLVRLEETLYSFGLFNFMDFVRPVGWRWTDGEPWAFIESESDFYEAGRVSDAVATDGALVASRLELSLSWAGADSTIWRWTPNASWVEARLTHPDAERTYVTRLAWNDDTLLASGLLPVGEVDDPDAAAVGVWESADGAAWNAVDPPPDAIQICALEAHPSGGFLAIGSTANGVSAWRRTGAQWSEQVLTDSEAAPLGPGGSPSDVCWAFPLGGALIALYPSDDGVVSWTSVGGAEWINGGTVAPQGYLAAANEDLLVLVSPLDPADYESRSIVRVGRIVR